MKYKIEDIQALEDDLLGLLSENDISFLVVDDSSANRKMISRYLSELGFDRLTLAKDGVDALSKLSQLQGRCFMIVDLNMPVLDGFGFLKKIKQDPDLNETPVLVVSSKSKRDKIVEVVKAGAIGYLLKPFSKEQLKEKIDQAYGAE